MSDEPTQSIRSLCVYCGATQGNKPLFTKAAIALAHALIADNITLVYGGAKNGLMGTLANQVLDLGGKVIGVTTDFLKNKEVAHPTLPVLYQVSSMHERKALMATLSDAFIALPGGLGTLDELFEIWTWAQLGLHQKPIGIYNVGGYYNKLFEFVTECSKKGFLSAHQIERIQIEDDIDRLLSKLKHSQNYLTRWEDNPSIKRNGS